MGTNNWTPDQWRAYNRSTGDRHVTRRERPKFREECLREDLVQELALAKLERRRDPVARVDAYKRAEMTWIRLTRALTFVQTGDDPE